MIRKHSLAEDRVTVDEFFELVADGQKADLIDGVIHMASPDSRDANRLTRFISSLLDYYIGVGNVGGEVFVNRFAFQLSDFRAPEPDVAYVRQERGHLIDRSRMRGGPDIAVEIVSRESRSRDYGEKRELYQQAGVSEYWIIDPLQDRAEFLRLIDGRYELVPLERNRFFRSQVVPGFWLDVEWLQSDPLPATCNCIQLIMAGPPSA